MFLTQLIIIAIVSILNITASQVNPIICLAKKQAFVREKCMSSCKPVDEVIEKKVCTSKCSVKNCTAATAQQCNENQVLVPGDGKCYCCPTCVDKKVTRKCPKRCPPKPMCTNIEYRECFKNDMVFVPADNDCDCCDSCKKIEDVITISICIPERCLETECVDQVPKDCLLNQVLVQKQPCFCCDSCVYKTEFDCW